MRNLSLVAAASLAILLGAAANLFHSQSDGLLIDRSRAELSPFLWGTKRAPAVFADEISGTLTDDPLVAGMQVLSVLRAHRGPRGISHSRKRLDRLYAEMRAPGYWPHKPHDEFPNGWWSAMDFASIALASLVLADQTGIDRYRVKAFELMDRMTAPVPEHGAMWRLPSGNCWFAEYAWDGQTLEKETWVLNGFLFALQAIHYFAKRDPERFKEKYECARNGLEEKRDAFDYADRSWVYYMLNPLTENQGHYAVYETIQLDAMFSLTGDGLYSDLAKRRRDLLRKGFPVYRVGDRIFFSTLGPPHPYRPDLYALKLELLDEEGKLLLTYYTPMGRSDPMDKQFIFDIAPAEAKTARVTSYSGADQVLLFETAIADISPSQHLVAKAKRTPILDAEEAEAGAITVNPQINADPSNPSSYVNHQARLEYAFEPLFDRSEVYAIGVEVEASQKESLQIMLTDVDMRQISRYTPQVRPGKRQLVLLSLEGFKDSPKLTRLIRSLTVVIDSPHGPKRNISFSDVFLFRNPFEIFQYAREHGIEQIAIERD